MNKIPKIIHFIWIDFLNELNQNPTIPKKYLKNIEHTKLLHSEYLIQVVKKNYLNCLNPTILHHTTIYK